MDSNSSISLDEKAINSSAGRSGAPIRWLMLIVVLAGSGYALYRYRATPAVADTAPRPATPTGSRGGGRGGRGGRGGPGGIAVTALAARKVDMPVYLRGLGSVSPFRTVVVRSRVDGELLKVEFKEGQIVHEGDLLADIDQRPFQVQLAQAEAQLAQARGNVERDTASLKGATTEFVRNQELLAKGLIPQQQADIQSATVDQFQGSLQADHAAMETAQAAIANANLQITYSHISAPISGRIGLRLVDPGNIVRGADPNGLAVIVQLQPITVLFNIPEDNLAPILKKLQSGQTLRVEAFDRDDQTRLATGTLLTVDNQIDQSTGTSRLKAVFDNPDSALFPNQFVNVHLLLEIQRNATVVPSAAVQRGPQGTYVYVVGTDRKVQVRRITVKNTEGSTVAVGPELRPGELVVVEGTDKVQDGGIVDVQVADEGPGL